MSRLVLCRLQQSMRQQFQRNIGFTAVIGQKTGATLDPIQQLFVDKIREYAQKSKAAGGQLVEVSPQVQQALNDQLERIDRIYDAKGKDMTQFPSFNFSDIPLEPVSLGVKIEDTVVTQATEAVEEEEDNRPYFDLGLEKPIV